MTSQLTLDKDSNYKDYKKILSIIKKGEFDEALYICQKMLKDKIIFDDLFNIIKSLQFWVDRKKKYYTKSEKITEEKSIEYLKKQWQDYKWHLSEYNFFQKEIFFAIRESVYKEIIKNYFLLLERTKQDNLLQKEIIFEASQYLLKIKQINDSYLLLNKSIDLDYSFYNAKRNMLLSNVYALKGKEEESLLWLKKSFVMREEIDYKTIYLPSVIESIEKMRQENFLETEIEIWLPVHLYISGLFYKCPLRLSLKELKKSKLLEIVSKKEDYKNSKDYSLVSSLIFCHLLLIEIYYHQKNDVQLKKHFYRLKKISNFIYENTKKHYI